ncbi:MAG: ETC complex I subunit [Candidatus Puniceispirillaceae bacterium]
MMKARIYQPAKTSMQSGRSKTKRWVLEHPRSSAVRPDNLMGWQSSSDTQRQVRLYFSTKEEAVAFAEARSIDFEVRNPKTRQLRMKTYADNFAFDRKGAWTH